MTQTTVFVKEVVSVGSRTFRNLWRGT